MSEYLIRVHFIISNLKFAKKSLNSTGSHVKVDNAGGVTNIPWRLHPLCLSLDTGRRN